MIAKKTRNLIIYFCLILFVSALISTAQAESQYKSTDREQPIPLHNETKESTLASREFDEFIHLPMVLYGLPPEVQPGFWFGSVQDFYVSPGSDKVLDYVIFITVDGCGDYDILHPNPVDINQKQFEFTGSFYGSGKFDTPKTATGITGLNKYIIDGCGSVSGGPWDWDAVWQNSSQPTSIINSVDATQAAQRPLTSGERFVAVKSAD